MFGLVSQKKAQRITDIKVQAREARVRAEIANEVPAPKETSSYIQIATTKKGCHLRIMGGNHKIRFHGENYYSRPNALRAAKLLSKETGLKIVDRTAK